MPRLASPERRWLIALLLWSAAMMPAGEATAAEPAAVAVFDFELVDTSLQGEVAGASPAELARLRLISELVRAQLATTAGFRVVDTDGALEAAGLTSSLRKCQGCEARIAAGLGADFALIGWVQKVSNLILNINVAVRDAATGRPVAAASVDIRGNTDESWLRGARYLVQHRLLGTRAATPTDGDSRP